MQKFRPIMESSFEVTALEQDDQANNIVTKNKLQALSYIYIHNPCSTELGFGLNTLWISSSSNVHVYGFSYLGMYVGMDVVLSRQFLLC